MSRIRLCGLLCFSLLSGCAKPPDLEAPCRNFGKHCSQQPINIDTTGEKRCNGK